MYNILLIPLFNFINIMKHIALTFILFLMLSFLDVHAQDKKVLNDFFYPEFIRYEATYRNQQIVFPRSSLTRPLTLGDQIDALFGNRSDFTDAYVCIGSWSGIVDTIYTSPQVLFDIDPMLLAYSAEKNGIIHKLYEEPNISIHLGYDADDGCHRYLTFFMRVRGMLNREMYARMTFMYPGKEVDDLLSYQSYTEPMIGSYITAFDAGDRDVISEDMKYYDAVYNSLKQKISDNEPLEKIEYRLIEGIYEKSMNAYDDSYAQWLFEEKRYSDALQFLEKGYLENRGDILLGNKENIEMYYRCCYQIGKSLQLLGINDKAEYYFGIAAIAGGEYEKRFEQFQSEKVTTRQLHNYQFVDADKFNLNAVTVGQILNNIYDLIPDYILSGKVRINGANNSADLTSIESWNYDLKKLCGDNPSILTLSYSKAYYQTESSVDASKLLNDNSIIITVHKISTSPNLWRVNLMIPNFKNDDDKKGDSNLNNPFLTSFVISNNFEIWDTNNLQSIYDKCDNLISQHLCAEAMNGLRYVYFKLKQKYADKKMHKNILDLYKKAGFKYGFTLVELNAPAKAIAYLKPNLEGGDVKEREEYINAIVGLQDMRAEEIILSELASVSTFLKNNKNDQDYMDYKNFLLRRKAYILIDKKEYDEAESIFKSQLEIEKDPKKLQLIHNELEYINQAKGNE